MWTLLNIGTDPDAADEDSTTPRHYAALCGFTKGVNLLLQFGCSLDIENDFFSTPLIYAASWNYIDIVRHLIKYNASTLYHETKEHNTALLMVLKQVLLFCLTFYLFISHGRRKAVQSFAIGKYSKMKWKFSKKECIHFYEWIFRQ